MRRWASSRCSPAGLISPVAGGLDVADHRRPHPGDPDLLGERPAWIGLVFRRAGLLATPEETTTPPVAKRARALSKVLARAGEDEMNGLLAIHGDPELRELHEDWLPARRPRQRGQITADRAVAEAKLADAETIEDAVQWLNRGERLVTLGDRALISMAARLPRRAKGETGAEE